jgi:SAM-dependent methyltransferase
VAELRYRRDLFAGTAEDYDRFRPPYPDALIADLVGRVPLGDGSRVLDLACGTGQVAFALAPHVGAVEAVDQEPEAVALGAAKAARLGIAGMSWRVGRAEDVSLGGLYDLVTIGNAFHRLDRPQVAARLLPRLADGGCVALLWGGSPTPGDAPWQQAMDATVERWRDLLGARDRVPDGWAEAMARHPHREVLRDAGLVDEGPCDVEVALHWTVDSLVGFVRSTSALGAAVLGDRSDEFAADLRSAIGAGPFVATTTFTCELARRPGS